MKLPIVSRAILLSLGLLLSVSALAESKGSLQFPQQVSIKRIYRPPRAYKVQWAGHGPEVELNILQGRQVVVTAPAHIIDLQRPERWDSNTVKEHDDGSSSLVEIRFRGKKYAFELTGEQPGSGSSSSGNQANK